MKNIKHSLVILILLLFLLTFVSCNESNDTIDTDDQQTKQQTNDTKDTSLSSTACTHDTVNANGICVECKEIIFSDGFEFSLNDDESSYSVKYFSGDSKFVIIPSNYKNLPVTAIGHSAFDENTQITSVIIPNSVTEIGDGAFDGCTNLTNIVIPNSVTVIHDEAFYNCTKLKNIVISDSIVYLGDLIFENTAYYNDKSNWENDVLYMENYLIKAMGTLSGVYEIKADTKVIAGDAFSECKELTKVIIPNSVISICDRAFSYCSDIKEIFIPKNVSYIGSDAFYKCSSIESIVVDSKNKTYHSTTNCLIETNTKTLVLGCKNSVIPNDEGILAIGDYSFYYCTGLKNIVIPDTVTEIGNYSFYKCWKLSNINIPTGVTHIGFGAFEYCEGITSIAIPNSVVDIGNGAFWGSGLRNINIPDEVRHIGDRAFEFTPYYIYEANWENDVLYIGNHLIKAKETLSRVYEIKQGTKTIADEAFENCYQMTDLYIPNSIENIGTHSLANCTKLTNIIFSGTMSEWKNINKRFGWNGYSGTYIINCADGDVTEIGRPITSEE